MRDAHPGHVRPTIGISTFVPSLATTVEVARATDRPGLDTAWTGEFNDRSAIVALAEMAHHTSTYRIGSSIAYAVGRSPLVLANEARGLDVNDDEQLARREVAAQIAFYTAPRAYAPMLEASGFAAEGERVRAAFADGDNERMIAAVSDDMIDAIAIAGTPEQVRAGIERRAGDFATWPSTHRASR